MQHTQVRLLLLTSLVGLCLVLATSTCYAQKQVSPCTDKLVKKEVLPGLWLETVRPTLKASVATDDPCLRLVRVDLSKFKLRLLTAFAHNGAKTAPEWLKEFGLVAVTNASMFRPSMRSTGLMRDGNTINNSRDTRKYGGFLAYGPKKAGLPRARFFGRGCPGFDLEQIQKDYRMLVQNYRILGCKGRPVHWASDKTHSTAAVAIDKKGHLVFAHLRAPYRTHDFAMILADPRLQLASAMYVEGGPEASLLLKAGAEEMGVTGSYETDFLENDSNHQFWALPNVLGISPRKWVSPTAYSSQQ